MDPRGEVTQRPAADCHPVPARLRHRRPADRPRGSATPTGELAGGAGAGGGRGPRGGGWPAGGGAGPGKAGAAAAAGGGLSGVSQ